MATTTLTTLQKSWANTRCVRSGHFAVFYPGGSGKDNTLVLYDAAGKEVAKNPDPLRDFDLEIDDAGEIFAIYTAYVDGDARPVKRWNTGVKVPVASAPPPAPVPGGNAATVEAIRLLLDKIT